MSLRIELTFFAFFLEIKSFFVLPPHATLSCPHITHTFPPFFTLWWKTIFWASPSGTFPTPLAVYQFFSLSLSRFSLVFYAKISFGIRKNVVVNETSVATIEHALREWKISLPHSIVVVVARPQAQAENVSLYCSHVVDGGFLAPQRERLQDSSFSMLWFLRSRSLCFSPRKIISRLCVCCFSPNFHPYLLIQSHLHIAKRKKALGVFFFGCQAISEQDDFQFSRDDEETFLLIIFLVLELSIVGGFFILFLLFTNVNGGNLVWKWKSSCWWAFFCASRTWLRAVWNYFNKKFILELF